MPPNDQPHEQAVDLTRTLMEVHRAMRAINGSVARRFELTAQQIEMLCVLDHRRPSFGELAELLGCDKTNITGMADRLARRGLVTRCTDDNDRRVTRLELTGEGRAFGATVRDAVAEMVHERWGALPQRHRAALVRFAAGRDHPSP